MDEVLGSEITADLGAGPQAYALCLMTTSSMAPAIRRGDLLLVERPRPPRFWPGDILLLPGVDAQHPKYSHRLIMTVIKNGRRCVLTKGDALPHYDAPVPVEAVLGRAAFVRRGGQGWLALNAGGVRAASWLAAHFFRFLLGVIPYEDPATRRTLVLRWWNDLAARWFCRLLERAPAPQLSGTPMAR